ncbi:hypothetical protein EMCRGX_G004015, partial [Ephydatia muelleri]
MAYAVVNSTSPFLQTTPGRDWIKVGYLDMTDPTQECPNSWQTFTSPRSSCGKKSSAPCDSLNIPTSGASYLTVCGWFRGYQIGTPDSFTSFAGLGFDIETYYVDGVSVTYGSPGNRSHVYTNAAGYMETNYKGSCPCAGGDPPPSFVGSDYYCESGNPGPDWNHTEFYYSDVLWDGQQCGGDESTCCNPPDLPWFCKTFPTPISEDLEVRICMDEDLDNENVAIESFALYIQVYVTPTIIIQPSDVLAVVNGNLTLVCEAEAFPPPQYLWEHIEGNLTGRSNVMGINSKKLELNGVIFGDEGSYICKVISNNITVASEIATVTLSPSTGVTVTPSSTTVAVNVTVFLNCSGLGGPGNIYQWSTGHITPTLELIVTNGTSD